MATKEITLSFATKGGELPPVSFSVADGESAYEIWLSLGNTGSEADFIKSLTGGERTLVTASKESPVNALTLPAGEYLLSESDGSYTLTGVPNFFPRTKVIYFTKTDQGVNLCAVDGKYYFNTSTRGTGWSEFLSAANCPTYESTAYNGVYWGSKNTISYKKGDKLIFGTEDATASFFGYSFQCYWLTGTYDGINIMYSTDGRLKYFIGGESSDTPTKSRLITIPTINQVQADSPEFQLPKLEETATLPEVIAAYNALRHILITSHLAKEAP